MIKAKIFWFTGLSGSGKSTICEALIPRLEKHIFSVALFDGDEVRNNLNKNLGFTKEDICTNNLLIADLCLKALHKNHVILVPVITPFEFVRKEIKTKLTPQLSFIYCQSDLMSVTKRDVKGLYTKAKMGKITNMIGFCEELPYEAPKDADLVIDTSLNGTSIDDSVQKAYDFIIAKCEKKHTSLS